VREQDPFSAKEGSFGQNSKKKLTWLQSIKQRTEPTAEGKRVPPKSKEKAGYVWSKKRGPKKTARPAIQRIQKKKKSNPLFWPKKDYLEGVTVFIYQSLQRGNREALSMPAARQAQKGFPIQKKEKRLCRDLQCAAVGFEGFARLEGGRVHIAWEERNRRHVRLTQEGKPSACSYPYQRKKGCGCCVRRKRKHPHGGGETKEGVGEERASSAETSYYLVS